MAKEQMRGGLVVWLVVLSAVSAFLLVENGILRDRFSPPAEGEVLLLEGRFIVTLDTDGHRFALTGSRLATESRFDGSFVPGRTVQEAMTGAGGCVWLKVVYRVEDVANNLSAERIACDGEDAALVVAEDGLGGRWIVSWDDAQRADVWGDARQFRVDQGQEVETGVQGATSMGLRGADDGVHYGPWGFRGSLSWVNHGKVAWRAA